MNTALNACEDAAFQAMIGGLTEMVTDSTQASFAYKLALRYGFILPEIIAYRLWQLVRDRVPRSARGDAALIWHIVQIAPYVVPVTTTGLILAAILRKIYQLYYSASSPGAATPGPLASPVCPV